MGIKHQVTYLPFTHSVTAVDMTLLSIHAWCMSTDMLLSIHAHRYGVAVIAHTMNIQWNGVAIRDQESLPLLTNSPFLKDHQSLLWTTLYAWNGHPVKWCCHQESPDCHMPHQYTCTLWRLTNQSLPCLTMMQSMPLIQCWYQRLPQPWCSECPWYSAGIGDYHSHDAVNVLDTVPESGHQCQPWLLNNPFMHTEKHLYETCCHQKCCTAVSRQQSTRFTRHHHVTSTMTC